jgi:hypothetical protein
VNHYMQREFFTLQPYAKHTMRSTEVDGSVPFVIPRGAGSRFFWHAATYFNSALIFLIAA